MARILAVVLGPHRISVNALDIGPTANQRNLNDDPQSAALWERACSPPAEPASLRL